MPGIAVMMNYKNKEASREKLVDGWYARVCICAYKDERKEERKGKRKRKETSTE